MIGSLCSGYGGLEMAIAGDVAWHAEIDPHASRVLAARYPGVANHGDLTAIDWSTVEPVDVLCGGFPCQPVSHAGKRKVTDDARWLWPHIADAVRVLRPRHVVLENVSGLLVPWRDGRRWCPAPIEEVLGDLASIGYVGSWRSVRASDVGAPHRRLRVFIVATDTGGDDPERSGERHQLDGPQGPDALQAGRAPGDRCATAPDADDVRRQRPEPQPRSDPRRSAQRVAWGPYTGAIERWEHVTGRTAPAPVDDRRRLSPRFAEWMMGLPDGWVTDVELSRSAQLRILGNGVVPQQAAHALKAVA